MSDTKRDSAPHILAKRAARVAAAPFVKPVGAWNIEAARYRGLLASSYLSAEQRDAARSSAVALLEEIRKQEEAMRVALAGEPPHGVIDDLHKSYARLSAQLQETIELMRDTERA